MRYFLARPMNCPICKSAVLPRDQNSFFPMCSERCQLVDLGNWLDGTYAIPADPYVDGPDPDADDSSP